MKFVAVSCLILGIIALLVWTVGFRGGSSQLLTPTPKPEIETVTDGSRTHIFINEADETLQISTGSANHRQPFRRGDFIVWVEAPQDRSEKYIVRYHVPTATAIRLTDTGVSQHPRVNTQGAVVWQQWTQTGWQIFFFDGSTSQQITSGTHPAIHPDIFEERVVYAQSLGDGGWQVEELSLTTKKRATIPNSEGEKYPTFEHDRVLFRGPDQFSVSQ